jgi:hypothetical protein
VEPGPIPADERRSGRGVGFSLVEGRADREKVKWLHPHPAGEILRVVRIGLVGSGAVEEP